MRSNRFAILAISLASALLALLLWSGRGERGGGAAQASSSDGTGALAPVQIRPARVKPGDPEIRVPAEPGLGSVRVELPFESGPREAALDEPSQSWVLRFLVPSGFPDGSYRARVILAWKDGRTEERAAPLRVDTTPAAVTVLSATDPVHPGGRLRLRLKPALPASALARAAAAPGGLAPALGSAMEVKEILVRAPWGEVARARMEGLLGAWEAELRVPGWARPVPARLEIAACDAAGNVSRRFYDVGVADAALPGWIGAVASGLLGGLLGGMGLVLSRPVRGGMGRSRPAI
jgi:hypothetical protein